MSGSSNSTGGVFQLCSVFDDSLRQFIESELIALTPGNERDLLICLSEVLDEIRGWIDELQGSEQGGACCSRKCNLHSGDYECLTLIVTNLISLLNLKSQYAQHLVINIFLVISEFLGASGNNWDNLIQLLCLCFEFTLCSMGSHSPSLSTAENSNSIPRDLNFLKLKVTCSTWNAANGIIGVLRGLIKLLKGGDDEHVRVLLNSLSVSFVKAPWDMVNVIHKNSYVKDGTCSGNEALVFMNAEEIEVKILFLGNLVQLLCSLVGLAGRVEDARTGPHDKLLIPHVTCELVPKLLYWCLAEEWRAKYFHIFPYFQHKILMLMIRLSFLVELRHSVLVQWLELIHKCYEDVLTKPIFDLECDEKDVLDGSPFLLSLLDQEVHPLSSRHLQRKAVFLFLRCSIQLIGLRKSTDNLKCSVRPNSCCASESNGIRDCCAGKKGLLGLFGWLQSCFPSDMPSNNDLYLERCIKFASSFIKLYIHEDDMLFEVLLQLFIIPSLAERLSLPEGKTFQGAEADILLHIAKVFNPVLLFHLFLAELQYDHQLLLDYLISKDTGSKCAEYLLRCLRTVCSSWTLFVEFSVNKHAIYRKSCKRKSCDNSYEEQSSVPSKSRLALSSEQHLEGQELEDKFCDNSSIVLEDAKTCLLSLKSSLSKLHRRKLFPYNPEVLIRRLTMFEEFCNQHG